MNRDDLIKAAIREFPGFHAGNLIGESTCKDCGASVHVSYQHNHRAFHGVQQTVLTLMIALMDKASKKEVKMYRKSKKVH